MNKFKIGIILKGRVYIEPEANNSYDTLLESLGIEDDHSQVSKNFVRAALLPDNGEWWMSPRKYPEKWKFVVEQRVTPDWFNREDYECFFRDVVSDWWKEHTLIDEEIEGLSSGFYYLKKCSVKTLSGDVTVSLYDSYIGEVRENACVDVMWGNSYINMMRENSYVNSMWGNSRINAMLENSYIREMREKTLIGAMLDKSQVSEMRENSCVGTMCNNSQIGKIWGNAYVNSMYGSSRIDAMSEYSYICEMRENSQIGIMLENSKIGQMREFSKVGQLWGMSQIDKIQDNAIAIDFRERPNIKIRVSANAHYEMVEV